MKLTLASWNVNSLRVRLPQVLQWLASESPDVLCLQETKTPDDQFPLAEIREAGYHAVFNGQKTYNGVAILGKKTATDVEAVFDNNPDPLQSRFLATTYSGIRIINLYVPNGSEVGSEKYEFKLDWMAAMQTCLAEAVSAHRHLIVCGDFNVAPEDRDVYDPEAWSASVLVSKPERMAMQSWLDTGLVDVFRAHEQGPGFYTWWDYRAAAFRRNLGLRIDHVLATPTLAKRCQSCYIDKTPRGWERPSDHAPVVATFGLS